MADRDFNDLMRTLNNMDVRVRNTVLTKGVHQSAKYVQGRAKKKAPANDGELRQKINVRIKQSNQGAVAEVYANVKHAAFVEFGTGPEGKASHQGISPNVSVHYRNKPWWINGSDISLAVAKKYHFPRSVSASGQVFYWTDGQKAQPYLYPALEESKNKVKILMKKVVQEAISEASYS